MNFLLFLLAGLLIYLKFRGTISWSWTVVAAIVIGMLLLPSLLGGGGVGFGTLFRSNNSNTNDPLKIDGCGCGPGQTVALSRRNMWGKYKNAGSAPCNVALNRVSSNGRYRIDGCIN